MEWCRAVDHVNLKITQGTTLGLVGESGCGKTTLGRTILRLVEATSGQVLFNGVDVLAASPGHLRDLRRNMQIIFQDPMGSLNPRMTVGQIVAEPLVIHREVRRRECRERVAGLLELVGMRAGHIDQYPHQLSGGQRQRVAIARALALRPKFIVCDEPVSALDVSIQSQILNLLCDLQRDLGLTYLFIGHHLAVIEHVSDRVAVMYLGRIVEIADAAEIYARPAHPYTNALLSAAPEPDPDRRRQKVPIKGEPPSAIDPPSECAFRSRCPLAVDKCRRHAPQLLNALAEPSTHLVACHRADAASLHHGV
ncbi:MAG: ATP-binding cassette domain-containing protein [Phycisphaerales bacterium]|nr:MAG: ATP-binding cassette domain-containing protein [Phycisphaerales bacterium]